MNSFLNRALRFLRQATERRLGVRIAKQRDDRRLYAQYPGISLERKLFFNIGAGEFHHTYWTNLDNSSEWYKGIQKTAFLNYDMMAQDPLPVRDAEAELLYTSHVIEHVSTEAVAFLFREAYRALKVGGVFRITCPDAALMYNATVYNQRNYWEWRYPWLSSRGYSPDEADIFDFLIIEICTARSKYLDMPGDKLSALEVRAHAQKLGMTEFFEWLVEPCKFDPLYPVHMNWWTYEKCRDLLQRGGFSQIMRSTHGGSCAAVLQNTEYFDCTSPYKSLYIDAIK
jgi:SAM-dependent methyltransferase